MTIDAGTWCLTQVEDGLRDALARSTKFQAWVGAADETAAKNFVMIDEDDPPADGKAYTDAEIDARFPMAIIEPPEDGESFEWSFDSSPQGYLKVWALGIRFIKPFEGTRTYQEERREVKNAIGEIMDQVRYDSTMRFGRLAPIENPQLNNEQDMPRVMWHYLWAVNDDTQAE